MRQAGTHGLNRPQILPNFWRQGDAARDEYGRQVMRRRQSHHDGGQAFVTARYTHHAISHGQAADESTKKKNVIINDEVFKRADILKGVRDCCTYAPGV